MSADYKEGKHSNHIYSEFHRTNPVRLFYTLSIDILIIDEKQIRKTLLLCCSHTLKCFAGILTVLQAGNEYKCPKEQNNRFLKL